MIIIRAERGRGRKPIIAEFATRDAAEAAVKGWLRYFKLTITIVED